MRASPAGKAMVREQIVARGVTSRRVLGAFLRVDRQAFVPRSGRREAFEDHPVRIACGQTVSQPFMVALMLEALEVRRGMRVLEVGSGSGYVLALLRALGANASGVEWHPELAEAIRHNLAQARIGGVWVRCGDGGLGWPERAPFDRILVSAACPRVPRPLFEQLREAGVLVAPVDDPGAGTQSLLRYRMGPAGLTVEDLGGCVFVPLLGAFGRGAKPVES